MKGIFPAIVTLIVPKIYSKLPKRGERAKQLLKPSDSHSHLTQTFRKITGVTPKAYRNC